MRAEFNFFKNGKPICIEYIDYYFKESDTETEVYDTCKLVVFLTDGLVAILDNKLIGGEKGDILVFNPSEVHFGRFLRQGEHQFLELYIPVSFFQDAFYDSDSLTTIFTDTSPDRINCLRGNAGEKTVILEIAQRITTLASENNSKNNMELFTCILRLLLMSSELYAGRRDMSGSGNVTPSYVLQAIRYISEHYSEKIKIEDIADLLGCSVAYLSRLFRKYVGTSLYNYIIEYRIHKAAILLKTNCSVTEACYLTGFEDCSNFIHKFKKFTGVTPRQYKKVAREKHF